MIKNFLLSFVPLFVAVDPVGLLPIYMSLTEGIGGRREQHRVVFQSVLTATFVAVAFLVLGTGLLRVLGITVDDFMIAGGLMLFIISLSDLVSAEKTQRSVDPETMGYVPIGVPLITGPAVLTTSVLLLDQYGMSVVLPATVVNIFLAGVVFWFAAPLSTFLGSAGTKAVSKIASLLLASIAVMMVRKGLEAIILGWVR